jgi:hypothetical protein
MLGCHIFISYVVHQEIARQERSETSKVDVGYCGEDKGVRNMWEGTITRELTN